VGVEATEGRGGKTKEKAVQWNAGEGRLRPYLEERCRCHHRGGTRGNGNSPGKSGPLVCVSGDTGNPSLEWLINQGSEGGRERGTTWSYQGRKGPFSKKRKEDF